LAVVLGVELVLVAAQRLAAVLQKDLAGDTAAAAAAVAAQLASAAVRLASEAVVPVSLPAMGHPVPVVRTKSISTSQMLKSVTHIAFNTK
jgi:hypothetical protein